MNCLSDELIQMFIDGEVPDSERIRIEAHISECSACEERVREQRVLSQSVISSLSNLVGDLPFIPGFIEPVSKHPAGKKFLLSIIYPLAAACVILFFLVFPLNRNQGQGIDIIVLSGMESEIDGNLPISEQEITYTVIESSAGGNSGLENIQLQTN